MDLVPFNGLPRYMWHYEVEECQSSDSTQARLAYSRCVVSPFATDMSKSDGLVHENAKVILYNFRLLKITFPNSSFI
jgi:hypothetical protein